MEESILVNKISKDWRSQITDTIKVTKFIHNNKLGITLN